MWRALQRGEAQKTIIVKRKGSTVKVEVDWSETAGEKERAAREETRRLRFGDVVYGEPVFGTKPSPPQAELEANGTDR